MARLLFLLSLAVTLAAKTPEWDRAYTLYSQAKFREAAAILEKASGKDPDNLMLLGQSYYELKNYGGAVEAFEKAAEAKPKDSNIFVWLGRAWGRRAEANKAFALVWARRAKNAFEKAVGLDPKNVDALDDLFEFYLDAPGIVGGGVEKAEAVARQIAQIDRDKGQRLLARVEARRK
jgi:tetratricopeptide (TPR) repeat protein